MTDLEYFSELKAVLLRKFCEANPYFKGGLKDFGVREIARFQNILQEKTGGRVSEKWFYTHLKKDHGKLPRVDVLDLLSQFGGHENWAAFQSAVGSPQLPVPSRKKTRRRNILAFMAIGALAFFTLMAALGGLPFENKKTYEACFVDGMTGRPLNGVEIHVREIKENESPRAYVADGNACFLFENPGDKITFSFRADYYRADTIVRILREQKQKESIPIYRDDYAWMIHVFSSGKIGDWKKRRTQLGEMIADGAMIFQVDANSGRAMELFNKPEFITKLTLPVSSLGELEILQTKYDETGKIQSIRFCQKK